MSETVLDPNEERLPSQTSSEKHFAARSMYILSVFGTYMLGNSYSALTPRCSRETVSSVGMFRDKYYPGAALVDNICFFRHALALDERRVKFLPEYAVAKKEWFLPGEFGRPRCKEVWFRGAHSDV